MSHKTHTKGANVCPATSVERNCSPIAVTDYRKAPTVSDTITFTLWGTPTSKGRPRFYNGRAVTDAKTRAAEQSILAAYLHEHGSLQPHDGPVDATLVFTFTPATSWPKWKTSRAQKGDWSHVKKPDLDNLIKAVLDGLNGRAWADDCQIRNVSATKQYGSVASTRVVLTLHPEELKENS